MTTPTVSFNILGGGKSRSSFPADFMQDFLLTGLGRLRLVAFLEGVSFLVLLLIAMPLKYLAGQPMAVRHVGMAHGLLFVLYLFLLIQQSIERGWSWRKVLLGFGASLVPLGTFWADRKLFRPGLA